MTGPTPVPLELRGEAHGEADREQADVSSLRMALHGPRRAPRRLATELIDHCRAEPARYKCPRRVELVDRPPRAENGKLHKRRLRDRYRGAAGTGDDVVAGNPDP